MDWRWLPLIALVLGFGIILWSIVGFHETPSEPPARLTPPKETDNQPSEWYRHAMAELDREDELREQLRIQMQTEETRKTEAHERRMEEHEKASSLQALEITKTARLLAQDLTSQRNNTQSRETPDL